MNWNLASLAHQVERRLVEPLKAQAAHTWRWWTSELAELLPPSWKQSLSLQSQRVFIEPAGKVFSVRTGSPETENVVDLLGSPKLRGFSGAEAVLVLPPAKTLIRSVTLPLAAEENLREVLSFEMDRQTPFPANTVYYDYVVTARDTRRRTLTVDLIVAPRTVVDETLAALRQRGITIDVVTARRPGAGVLPISLLTPPRRNRNEATRPLSYAITATVGVLLAAAIVLPIWRKQAEIATLEPQVAAVRAQAAETIALRHEVERLVQASTYLLEKKQNGVLVMQALDEISSVLPEHSYASRLELAPDRVTVYGQSTAAASLIPLLEESSLLRNVQFDSSVVRVGNDGKERFQITAEIESGRTQ